MILSASKNKISKTEYYVPDLKASLDYVCPDDPVIGMTFTLKDSKFCLVLTSLYISQDREVSYCGDNCVSLWAYSIHAYSAQSEGRYSGLFSVYLFVPLV